MIALLSTQVANEFAKKTGIEVLALKEYRRLDTPVSSHADMLICKIENTVFCYEDYYLENREIFDLAESFGYRIIKCAPPVSNKYPYDIGLNALIIGKRVFGRVDCLCAELKKIAIERGYTLINVKQGYTACSTLALDEGHIVTGDISIKNAAEKEGISVTFIEEKSIKLNGYGYGFIGGATAVAGNKIYAFGEAENLSSYEKIKACADALDMELISIMSGDVVDFGGVRLIKQ